MTRVIMPSLHKTAEGIKYLCTNKYYKYLWVPTTSLGYTGKLKNNNNNNKKTPDNNICLCLLRGTEKSCSFCYTGCQSVLASTSHLQ